MKHCIRAVAGTFRLVPILALLAALPLGLYAQPSVQAVSPTAVELVPGGAAQVVRVTVSNLTDVSAVRVMQGRSVASGFTASASRTSLSSTRSGSTAAFDVRLAAGSSVAAGTYTIQLISGAVTLGVPLQVTVGSTQLRTTIATQPQPTSPLTVPRLSVSVGCSGAGVHVQPSVPVSLPTLTLPASRGPVTVEVCATPGYAEYRWKLVEVLQITGSNALPQTVAASAVQAAPDRFVITVPEPLQRQLVRLELEAIPALVSAPPQGGRMALELALPNVPQSGPPSIQRFWVDNIRPGASGRIENQGIFDPALTLDPSDGTFWIQGTNLDAADLRVFAQGTEATIMSRTRSGSTDVIRARVRDFRHGHIEVRHAGGRAFAEAARLGYWLLPVPDLNSLLQNIRCSLGSPVGRATVVLPKGTITYTMPPMEENGFRINIVDMNSSAVTLRVENGITAGRDFVVVTQIDFETAGREFEGSFLPTISWWECGTFRVETTRCATLDLGCFAQVVGTALASSLSCGLPSNWQQRTGPGPAVPVAGDLISPRAVFRTRLEIDPGTGKLRPGEVNASFTADITLQTGIGTVPLGPLKTLILQRTDADLKALMKDAGFADEIARLVNGLSSGFGVGQLRFVQRTQDGRVFMEYTR